jgi:NADPH:quinone reductase-like Zn-dependent oxidoreductase
LKAIVYEKGQKKEKLFLCEVEKPVPAADEVLIKVVCCSINAADYRSMQLGIIPKRRIFGADVAGRVEAVGEAVTRFKVGDEVFGDLLGCGSGGFAEYTTGAEKLLAHKPAGVSFVDACAIPIAGITALQGLRDLGKLQSGQKVLIVGAGGGVGTFAVQLAKILGAEVTAVCGAHNVELVKSLGADRVIDYSKETFVDKGEKYHLILGVNGSHSLFTYYLLLTPKGIFVMAGGGFSQLARQMLFGWLYSLGNRKMHLLSATPSIRDLDYLIQLVAESKIKPVIEKTVPLEETPSAFHTVARGHSSGKVVIAVESLPHP